MPLDILPALAAGAQRVVAWADVLDRINVFPVPDGDTGRNLVFSLGPLRRVEDRAAAARQLMLAARGNSGNIASRFFTALLDCDDVSDLTGCVARGRGLAYEAVAEPKAGTMLTLFDVLVDLLARHPAREQSEGEWLDPVLGGLEDAVRGTTDQLEALKTAGVVDAGALGMFIFFEAFFNVLAGRPAHFTSVGQRFGDGIQMPAGWAEEGEDGFCLDVVLEVEREAADAAGRLHELGESVVTISEGDLLKVHLHAPDARQARNNLARMGRIVRFSADDLTEQVQRFARPQVQPAVHIMTDGAGTMTRDDAARWGMTLLDSYINIGEVSLPETYVDPDQLYQAMRQGRPVSTAQASVIERREMYQKAINLHGRVLYFCVGSVYTGNFQVAEEWRKEHDPEGRMTIIDTGAASGKLGLAALATAKKSTQTDDPDQVAAYARWAAENCREFIFLDKLQYLARGGRLSRTSAFFGDMLKMKPVVTPTPNGVEKVGVARSVQDQVGLAQKLLEQHLPPGQNVAVMLEHTDNRDFLAETVQPMVQRLRPEAEILFRPVSLTSGAHMGPGTWALAWLPVE